MKLTGQKIVSDVIALLRDTPIAEAIGGNIYRGGLRPRDSKAEDLVVIFTDADAGQFQDGTVTLNIYVPDIRNGSNGVLVSDEGRCEVLETLAQESLDLLTVARCNYWFRLRDAIHTRHDDEIDQSFIVARIGFRHFE